MGSKGEAPLVSVGMPTYNRPEKLRRAVNSVLAQDYSNIEIIISDNASTDDTENVCRELAKSSSRIRYVRHPANLGSTRNFNKALELSSGDYFMWLADDDWLSGNYISTCVRVLESNANIGLCGGIAEFPDRAHISEPPHILNMTQDSPEARVFYYLWNARGNSIFYGLYRTPLIKKVGVKHVLAGDWLTVAAIAAIAPAVVTAESAIIYRSSGGVSRNHKNTVRALGFPAWQAYAPKLAIAIVVWLYFSRDYPFDNFTAAHRRRFARMAFFAAMARKRIFRFLIYLIPRSQRPEFL